MLAVIMAIENEDDRLFVETVFNRYAKKLYLVAYNILGNRADAEDCVQDTFVKIIDKLDRFKNAQKDDSLIKLLVIVCRNTALDMYDKNKRIAETQLLADRMRWRRVVGNGYSRQLRRCGAARDKQLCLRICRKADRRARPQIQGCYHAEKHGIRL